MPATVIVSPSCTLAKPSTVALALAYGVKAVANQVEKDPRYVLRDKVDRPGRCLEIALQRHIEVFVLGPCTVVGEVQSLLDQIVDVAGLPIACTTA